MTHIFVHYLVLLEYLPCIRSPLETGIPSQVSTNGSWCQFNTNRNPKFGGAWKKETLFSASSSTVIQPVVLQTHYETAWFWGSPRVRLPCSASFCFALLFSIPLCLLCSALVLWDAIGISALAEEIQSSEEREGMLSEPEGKEAVLYR